MIDRPPEYGITCECSMRITGTNENGVISLMKRHIESGVFHTGYLMCRAVSKETSTENILFEISTLRKGIRNASTRGSNNNN